MNKIERKNEYLKRDPREVAAQSVSREAELWELLEERIYKFTSGESSSIPAEMAERLLRSIIYCIEAGGSAMPSLNLSLRSLFLVGKTEVKKRVTKGRGFLKAAMKTHIRLGNIAYDDTLLELQSFFKNYDIDYFAHEVPCMIDYQLSQPVEGLNGIDFINEFLRHFITESRFINCFDKGKVPRLLRVFRSDYIEMVSNLYEPILGNALGLELIGKDPHFLNITEVDRADIIDLITAAPREELESLFQNSARSLVLKLGVNGNFFMDYIARSAHQLLAFIDSLEGKSDLKMVFITFDV